MTAPVSPASGQRVDEWVKLDAHAIAYHLDQWDNPKESTKAFARFVADKLQASGRVIDFGGGAGGATSYLARAYPQIEFTAFDYAEELSGLGNRLARERNLRNLTCQQGDWYNLALDRTCEGAISLQTLMGLPDCERPLRETFRKLGPAWMGISSLFYDGDISSRIEIHEHQRGRKAFYNIYAIPEIGRICESEGYRLTRYEPFVIGIDLPRPSSRDMMGTYTRRVVDGAAGSAERIQISGPIMMQWYFLMIERKT